MNKSTDRDRLIELLRQGRNNTPCCDCEKENFDCIGVRCDTCEDSNIADYLLANGVIVPPCKVGDYVRFKGLTTLWQVEDIHYYREGLPQISVTNGKITNTVTDFGTFEVFTKEQAEKALKEREG